MNLADALYALGDERATRAASRQAHTLVSDFLAAQFRHQRSVSEADADDLKQDIHLRLIDHSRYGKFPIELSEAGARGYVRRCAQNAIKSTFRGSARRVVPTSDETLHQLLPPTVVDPTEVEDDLDAQIAAARSLYRRVAEQAVEHAKKNKDKLVEDYEFIEAIAFQDGSVTASLERQGVDTQHADFIKRRDALYTRHYRARDRLSDAFQEMETGGQLSPDESAFARLLLSNLVKCQIPDQAASSDGASQT
jgi:DNA-directed RNA polymerase specialized sigma24 family protein